MWGNTVERGRPQVTIWHMHIACWIPKAALTISNTDCFSPATMVTRKPLAVTLRVLFVISVNAAPTVSHET